MTGVLKTIDQFAGAGLIPGKRKAALATVVSRYAAALTPALRALIDPADPCDPIARQFVPDERELETSAEELADPIGDHAHEPVPGLVHRYADRVLLKLVQVCPVYCRFCFRREMVGPGRESPLAGASLDAALDYIRQHDEIWEAILTGGDPFIVPARSARSITAALEEIPHLRLIRWHTRVPIADPKRVSQDFIEAIAPKRKTVFIVIHVNHARELASEARSAIARLVSSGFPVLSQSVLLRGVNDRAETLAELMRALVELRVKPYYLHQADFAPGTAHFRIPLEEAQQIYGELRRRVSGLCVPQFVVDIPGGRGKVPAGRSHMRTQGGVTEVADDAGNWTPYPTKAG